MNLAIKYWLLLRDKTSILGKKIACKFQPDWVYKCKWVKNNQIINAVTTTYDNDNDPLTSHSTNSPVFCDTFWWVLKWKSASLVETQNTTSERKKSKTRKWENPIPLVKTLFSTKFSPRIPLYPARNIARCLFSWRRIRKIECLARQKQARSIRGPGGGSFFSQQTCSLNLQI